MLVVEAPSVFREMQALFLSHAGYDAISCDGPREAFELLHQQTFRALVLNNEGSILESAEFLVALRREHPAIAVVFVATALTLELTRDLTRLGITAILERPVSPQSLTRKLDEVLGLTMKPAAPAAFVVAPVKDPEQPAPAPQTVTVAVNTRSIPGTTKASPASPMAWSTPPFTLDQSSRNSTAPFTSYTASPFRPASAAPFANGPYIR